MTQLLLGLAPQPAPSFDNFVIGRNAVALAALRAFGTAFLQDRCIYLWGEAGSGCTHLLRAWSTAPERHAVDAVESLGEGAQIELFNLYNRVRDGHGHLLVAGCTPPLQLALRADLKSRLAWGLSFEIHALSEDEKRAALAAEARARAMPLTEDMLSYLLSRARRDMSSLMQLIDALDRHSLETKRPITLPLLREILNQSHVPGT